MPVRVAHRRLGQRGQAQRLARVNGDRLQVDRLGDRHRFEVDGLVQREWLDVDVLGDLGTVIGRAAPGTMLVVTVNAQVEGDDTVNKVITPAVRLDNRTQISSKAVGVSGTQQSVTRAGITNELAEQVSLASLELKTDIEFGLTNSKVSATSPRKSRGLTGWVVDNVNSGAGYVAASYINNTAGTDGTTRAFTEAQLKDVLQKVYIAGGTGVVSSGIEADLN